MTPLERIHREPGKVVVVLRPHRWWGLAAGLAALTVVAAVLVLALGRAIGSMVPAIVMGFAIQLVGCFAFGTVAAVAWWHGRARGRDGAAPAPRSVGPPDLSI